MRFEKLAMDQENQDGSYDKLRARCRDNIISAHGVPPRMVGVVVSGSLGGSGETSGQLKIFQEATIGPRQSLFEVKLAPVIQDMLGAEIVFERMDTDMQEKRSEFYPALVGAGILTVDEAREALGFQQQPALKPDKAEKSVKLVKALHAVREAI